MSANLLMVNHDTQGIIDFADSGFKNPLLVFNGFFLNDNGEGGDDEPELSLYGRLSASAELNLGIARAGVAGGIGMEIGFDLFDPNHDGKIRISEIIGNFENEAKYAPTADGVSIGVWRRSDEIQVYVTDDGPGVPLEDWESVFEPFVRIQGRGRSRGSGIGLFAARRLMDAMGGRVWLEPNGYGGSRFIVALPAEG